MSPSLDWFWFVVVWLGVLALWAAYLVGKYVAMERSERRLMGTVDAQQLKRDIMIQRGFRPFTLACGHTRWINPEHFETDDLQRVTKGLCTECKVRQGVWS